MKVTVFGATGQLGSVLVPQLVAAGHDVVAVVRREDQVPLVEAQGATAVIGDLENGSVGAAFVGTEAVVWAAGANLVTGVEHSNRVDRDGAERAIEDGAAAGVGRWIQVSSMFANRWEAGPPPLHPFLQNKASADQTLKDSGMSWTILRPGHLTNDEPVGAVTVADELPFGQISRADVSALIVALLDSGRGLSREFDLAADPGGASIADITAGL